jgi:four helix bundle protein
MGAQADESAGRGSYRELVAWQKAMSLVTNVYSLTKSLPPDERYGLSQQMRRSAVSIPSNIAEGQGRHATADFVRFLRVARGSLFELRTQAEICTNLQYPGDWPQLLTDVDEVSRCLAGLIRSLTPNG